MNTITPEYAAALAINAYHAYGSVTDHKNYAGLPMPGWYTLPPKIQEAWCAAVTQVSKDLAP